MRREISSIFLFFLVLFTFTSLVSFSPNDPAIHTAAPANNIHNVFGILGAYVSGFFIGLFGVGAFWFPFMFGLILIHLLKKRPPKKIITTIAGGLILITFTGILIAFKGPSQTLWGQEYSSGGFIGIPIQAFLLKYTNFAGGILITLLFLSVGFILATQVSILGLYVPIYNLSQKLFFWVKSKVFKGYLYIQYLKSRRKQKITQSKPVKEKGIKIKTKPKSPPPKKLLAQPKPAQIKPRNNGEYQLPPVDFLVIPENLEAQIDKDYLRMQSELLEKKLEDYGVKGKIVTVSPGPVITTFEYAPAPGVKINKIVNLSDDLSLALKAMSIRIIAPIPGKAAIGIEIPNHEREFVYFKEIVTSENFNKATSKLTLCMGKDIVGYPVVAEMDKMPHLLIAGATGTGKSVCLNSLITSLIYKATPDDVKLIMIDPKRIELSVYDGIPHLITPVVTDMKKATNALFWAVKEMERRYEVLAQKRVRNIEQYNQKIAKEKPIEDEPPPTPLPLIVIIIDELADLMMVASRDVEVALTRLAQMARAAGIHLIIATQRPSVDVLTGIIKANFPTRISFQVSSKIDSRTIIDTNGAENLLGNGDMLFLPPGTARLQRIHGSYISEDELGRVIEFLKAQKQPEYSFEITEEIDQVASGTEKKEYDEKYDEAVALVTQSGQASISMVQRHLRIGYNRAARIIEIMEKEGVVGPSDGVKPREVIAQGFNNIP